VRFRVPVIGNTAVCLSADTAATSAFVRTLERILAPADGRLVDTNNRLVAEITAAGKTVLRNEDIKLLSVLGLSGF
jgi:hypothetical protein